MILRLNNVLADSPSSFVLKKPMTARKNKLISVKSKTPKIGNGESMQLTDNRLIEHRVPQLDVNRKRESMVESFHR